MKSRFKGTAFGWTWSLLVPLATVITYSIVFSVIFRASPPDFGSGRPGNFTVWLMVGLVPWTFFLIAINIAIPTLLSNGPLLQKIYFPAFAPVLGRDRRRPRPDDHRIRHPGRDPADLR